MTTAFNLTEACSYLAAGDQVGFVSQMGAFRDRLQGALKGKLIELVKNFLAGLWEEYSSDPKKLYDIIRQLLGGWITLPPLDQLAATPAGVQALSTWDAQSLTDQVMAREGDVQAAGVDAEAVDPAWVAWIVKFIIELLLKAMKPATT